MTLNDAITDERPEYKTFDLFGLVNEGGYQHFVWLGNVAEVFYDYEDQEVEAINNFTKEIRLKNVLEEWEY